MIKSFTADVEQLIQLVTHSIYSSKEIFLRELLANANDAIQKAKLKAIEDPNYLGSDTNLQIIIDVDKENNILTITDNGIGMTPTEVEENIGTIAKSGTKAFLEALKKSKGEGEGKGNDKQQESNLIGQFGIGFYSAFMVAKKVELETKSNDSEQATLWVSEGKGSYEIKPSNKKTRGTIVRLFLSEENKEFADLSRIKDLVRKYSNYLPVPILMHRVDKDGKEVYEYEQVNAIQSLWTKHKKDVKKEEYKDFYKELTFDEEEPLDTIHVHTEGILSYKALLFVPKKLNPFLALMEYENAKERGPNLYVNNVLIMNNCKDLLPNRLRFVKGVVETSDLSLNVSREILQHSPTIEKLKSSLTKEVLKSLEWQQKNNPEAYEEFHKNYGRILKEGIIMDPSNKDKIASIVLFYSYKKSKYISLDEYIANNQEGEGKAEQKESSSKGKFIYYLCGSSLAEIRQSPYLDQFKTAHIDVLLMTDPIDEYVMSHLRTYKEHVCKSISDQDIFIGDEQTKKEKEKEQEKLLEEHKNFVAFVMSTIGSDKLEKVTFTTKTLDVPALIVTKDGQPSAQIQKVMKAIGQELPPVKKILELNSRHPLIQKTIRMYEENPTDERVRKIVYYLYDQAILLEGGEIEDMVSFIKRVNELL